MDIKKFVGSLPARIERSDLTDDLEQLTKELRESTLPPYKSAESLLKDWDWKDRDLQAFDRTFLKGVDSRFKGNSIEVIYEILNRTADNIATLKRLLEKSFAPDIMKSALTYSKSQLLQYTSAITFAAKYSRKHLLFVLARETNLYRQNHMVGKELTKAEIAWLETNRDAYITVMRALDHSEKELLDGFESIPDIDVDVDNYENVVSNVGLSKVDPFGMGAVGFVLNPFYHIGLLLAEWQVARRDAAIEERQLIEYELQDLKNAFEKTHDPKLEKAIEYTRDRLERQNFKIAKMESK